MLIVLILIVLIALILGAAMERRPPTAGHMLGAESIYDLSAQTLTGELVDLNRYHGRMSLVVNTGDSPDCALRYAELEALHQELAAHGFTVLGFLSDDFSVQESATSTDAHDVAHGLAGVTFPMFTGGKVTGDDCNDVYRILTMDLEPPNGDFTMYLVAWTGQAVARFGPQTHVDDAELRAAIEEALDAD